MQEQKILIEEDRMENKALVADEPTKLDFDKQAGYLVAVGELRSILSKIDGSTTHVFGTHHSEQVKNIYLSRAQRLHMSQAWKHSTRQ